MAEGDASAGEPADIMSIRHAEVDRGHAFALVMRTLDGVALHHIFSDEDLLSFANDLIGCVRRRAS